MTLPPGPRQVSPAGGQVPEPVPASEEDAELAQKLGQLQPFYSCILTGVQGPACGFWASLTPFPPADVRQRPDPLERHV
jgi:hypothetical protein